MTDKTGDKPAVLSRWEVEPEGPGMDCSPKGGQTTVVGSGGQTQRFTGTRSFTDILDKTEL